MLEIDGSMGEGGGQVLRSSLSLALCLQRPFRMVNIRAARSRPGLQCQHLAAVRAAAQICGARVDGARLHSRELGFVPSPVTPGHYRFDIGSAGSTTLVMQTVLPPLLTAGGASQLVIQGGTHNPLAPPFEFIRDAYLPLLRRMGASVEIALERPGFYPAGGGELAVSVGPAERLAPISVSARGKLRAVTAGIWISQLPTYVFQRESDVLCRDLGIAPEAVTLHAQPALGPGNAMYARVVCDAITEVFSAIGRKGRPAERVAGEVVSQVRAYLDASAPVGPYLADQLLLPVALAGGGCFIASEVTRHAATNARVIEAFGLARVSFDAQQAGMLCRVVSA